jgi:membrane-associated phospholipid phosphatase
MGKALTKDWRVTAACAAGISLIILADKPITTWYQDHIETTIKYKLPALPGAGSSRFFYGNDAYLNYAILGLYGGSLAANYKTGQMAALNSMKALAYSYLITQVTLKAVFGRDRPDPTLSDGKPPKKGFTDDPYNFFNFHRIRFNAGGNVTGMSFPSMHATAYFAVAKVMAMEFHNYWIPYGTVAVIFLADVDAHQHWVGDMVAGGLLGTVIGQGIVTSSRLFEKKQEEKLKLKESERTRHRVGFNYQVLPSFSSSMSGITFLASF